MGERDYEVVGRWVVGSLGGTSRSVRIRHPDDPVAHGTVLKGKPAVFPKPETVEYPTHPWFIGVQYHPELKSRPFEPHPLFRSFIEAAVVQSRLV